MTLCRSRQVTLVFSAADPPCGGYERVLIVVSRRSLMTRSAVAGLSFHLHICCPFFFLCLDRARPPLRAGREAWEEVRMSTRSLLRASPLFCAALFVACAEERGAAPLLAPPSFSRQGEPATPPASRFYQQHNLVSDGAVPADHTDPNLVNAWGLVSSPTSPWWISDNGTGRSTLYTVSTGAIPLIVTVPGPMGRQGTPTGVVFNGGTIYVTYALQDADKHDDVPGEGHGFVDAFDTGGNLIRRVASKGELNSPWGLALAPPDFGSFGNDLLVGNFGNGRVHAFDPGSLEGNGEFQHRGPLHSAGGPPIAIDGLWALGFGKGAANNGPTNTLFFTAGPVGEQHGLFGTLVGVSPPAH